MGRMLDGINRIIDPTYKGNLPRRKLLEERIMYIKEKIREKISELPDFFYPQPYKPVAIPVRTRCYYE